MNKRFSARAALAMLVACAGAALCLTLATLALSEVSYNRFGQALLAAAIATALVRLIKGPRIDDELDDWSNGTQL